MPIGIPLKDCIMVPKSAFSAAPTVDLSREAGSSEIIGAPQQTSTPIKQCCPSDRSTSGKKMDISKIQATHLLHELSNRLEDRRRGGPSLSSSRGTAASCGAGVSLPAGLPAQAPGLTTSVISGSTSGKAVEVPCPIQQVPPVTPATPVERGTAPKHPAPEDDDAAPDIEEVKEISGPPKKKKKKKDKHKEHKESGASENPTDTVELSTSSVTKAEGKPEDPEVPKKKKKKKEKKSALEKFQEDLRTQKAREMALACHRGIQHARDFPAVIAYRQTLDPGSLDTINGADHTGFLIQEANKDGSYLNQKNGKERNILDKDRLMKAIAKCAEKKTKRLKEAQELMEATFSMVVGMPRHEKHRPTLAIQCLMDCNGNTMDCDHLVYGKEQNIGLHGVIHPTAMSRVTVKETFTIDGHETTVKVDHAYCPFCGYSCSSHRVINNHVRMHFQSILFCGWPGCFYVCMLAQNMLDHSRDKHGMKRAPPLQDRKKKSRDPDDEDDD